MVQPAQASTRVAPTAALTVKAVERLAGSGTRFAYAVKAGPWIFLNGHEAFDFERGLAPEVEGPSGHRLNGRPPLRREADYILQRMRTILKEFGCDLANAVRRSVLYRRAGGACLSPGALCRVRRLHSAEHVDHHAAVLHRAHQYPHVDDRRRSRKELDDRKNHPSRRGDLRVRL